MTRWLTLSAVLGIATIAALSMAAAQAVEAALRHLEVR